MTAFFDLFVRHSADPSVRDDPTWADRSFPDVVASSPFHLWRPGDPIAKSGARYLIGVATWSGYDMLLLDLIAEIIRPNPVDPLANIAQTLRRSLVAPPAIDVFNMADCRQDSDVARYISGLGSVSQTPIGGLWRDGQLEWSGQGHLAREFLAGQFGFSSSEVVAFVQDRIKARQCTP